MSTGPRFNFCPYDAAPLQPRSDAEGHSRPTCPVCRFIDYGNPKPCVAVLIEDGNRVLLGQRAVEPAKGMWDILGGFIDAGETAEAAVHREVLEETGLEVRIARYLGAYPDTYGPRQLPTLNLGFVAVVRGGTLRAASDVGEVRWFAPDEIPAELAFPHQRLVIEAWRERGPFVP